MDQLERRDYIEQIISEVNMDVEMEDYYRIKGDGVSGSKYV